MSVPSRAQRGEGNVLESQMLVPLNLLAIAVYLVLNFALPPSPGGELRRIIVVGLIVTIFILSLLAHRFGRLRLSSWLTITGLLTVFILSVPANGGLQAPGMAAFIFPALVAGFLINRGVMIALGILLIIYTFVLAYVQEAGGLPPPIMQHSVWSRALVHSVIIAAVLAVAWYALMVVARAQGRLEREVVERKKAEDEVRLLNQQLEQRVAERTADLNAFTSMVSHDLRGPVRHAQGFARMLVEDKGDQLDDEAKEYIDRIVHSAYRMNSLIDDLLTLSRIGVRPLQTSESDMTAIVQSAVDTATNHGKARVDLEIGELGRARADAGLLRVVWENLIGNAIKFTQKEDNPEIRIGSEERGGRMWYWIEDNGVGFDEAYVDKIFDVFERLHSNDEFKGSGVGLSTVKRIVEKHGGSVQASGQVGVGAKFEFTLTPVDEFASPSSA